MFCSDCGIENKESEREFTEEANQYLAFNNLSSREKKKAKNVYSILQESVESATLLPLKKSIKTYIEMIYMGNYREQNYLRLKMRHMKQLKSPSNYGLPEEFHIFTMSKDDPSPSHLEEVQLN